MDQRRDALYIVVPCYNEEAALPDSAARLTALLDGLIERGKVAPESRLLFVDDGSRDGTWAIIKDLTERFPSVEGLKLAHNAGHQNALWAGMMTVREKAGAVVTIDADLQDDPNAIAAFVDAWHEGYNVVYGVRSKRETDTAFKRDTAHLYYGMMKRLGVDLVYDHADYRLLDRAALDALARFGETNLFLRGMVPLLGFKQKEVAYERGARLAGESKYPLRKMLALALEGVTSFTVKPIMWIVWIGLLFGLFGFCMLLYAIIALLCGSAVPGWTSIMVSVWLIGGAQLVALGLIGQYVGKIYSEVKHRPKYIVEDYLQGHTPRSETD